MEPQLSHNLLPGGGGNAAHVLKRFEAFYFILPVDYRPRQSASGVVRPGFMSQCTLISMVYVGADAFVLIDIYMAISKLIVVPYVGRVTVRTIVSTHTVALKSIHGKITR